MNRRISTAIYKILRPLVVLLFHNGVSFNEFSSLAKQAYIEVTEKELLKQGQKATTSIISISTGLTRKEVAALRKEPPSEQKQNHQKNRAIRVIAAWTNDADYYQGKDKSPKILEIQGKQGSFESLVNKYSGDMPYRAMLKELLRIKSVELLDDNRVALVQAAFIPIGNEEKYDFLGEDASSLISTIKHNILNKNEQPRFQRKVSYNGIPENKLKEFKIFSNKENQSLLMKLNSWLAKHDTNKSDNTVKVGVGVYYFEEGYENQRLLK